MRRAAKALATAAGAALLGSLLLAAPALACGSPETVCTVEGDFGAGEYRLALPEARTEGAALPVVVVLHGYGGQAAVAVRSAVMAGEWLARGWAVLAPQGMPRREGDAGGAWNSRASTAGRDDVAFLRAVLADAAARAPIDPTRAVLGGFSGGGMMTWRVACDAPGAFRAYLPVAGLLWRPLPEACAGPAPMLHVHGWSDPVVPLEGRSVAGGRITQGDLFAGLALMRAANGCTRDDPDQIALGEAFWLRRWNGCAGAPLAFALHPAGHVVPSGWADLALDWLASLEATEE
ncbi:PHB depolymerase family esterase [Albimonas sp. CAU 1670]|uniref:alpha/beta hydrolase family esterase n=1 Tax=Albimonas sp. CAU 1670 TaxID=3032599 RepID=UPI0023DCD7A5|nr:PHB depolymerase family esterase [Albimonas sp. CAU 1670]MDF2232475.1 PHB depolymerase family esterase [Albimonas sp. CAU 1670]